MWCFGVALSLNLSWSAQAAQILRITITRKTIRQWLTSIKFRIIPLVSDRVYAFCVNRKSRNFAWSCKKSIVFLLNIRMFSNFYVMAFQGQQKNFQAKTFRWDDVKDSCFPFLRFSCVWYLRWLKTQRISWLSYFWCLICIWVGCKMAERAINRTKR